MGIQSFPSLRTRRADSRVDVIVAVIDDEDNDVKEKSENLFFFRTSFFWERQTLPILPSGATG